MNQYIRQNIKLFYMYTYVHAFIQSRLYACFYSFLRQNINCGEGPCFIINGIAGAYCCTRHKDGNEKKISSPFFIREQTAMALDIYPTHLKGKVTIFEDVPAKEQ